MNKQLVILSICSVGAVMLLLGSAQQADAAAYMKLGDIKGESTDQDHKDWINLLSMSHVIEKTTSNTGTARQRGSTTFGDIVVVKEIDKSTPKLQESIAKGERLATAVIDFTRSDGEGQQTYLTYELKNVIITSYAFKGDASGDPLPTDQVSFNFEEIKVTYYPQNRDGTSGAPVSYSWKVEEGRK